ncbi:unnamed protein product [Adineta steineri]|uniref:Kinesin light chain n=1 Tax=Adineta steineri TaxID=433720 RepID=A0A819GA08_9BILA|nr:unnamed protein product [Adineta steineri]
MLSKVKFAIKSKRNRRALGARSISLDEQINLNLKSTDEFFINNQQRTETNEEDITIVWLSKTKQNKSLITSLRFINDYIQLFDDEENALTYIQSILEEKIIVIIDYLNDHLLTVLNELKQVDAIFLFTSTSPSELPSCITAFCSTDEELINEIDHTCQQINKHLAAFSIYNHKNKEKQDLTHEARSFLFFQLFKAAFKKLPTNSESKKLMISKYRDYYVGNRRVLNEILDFELNYKSNKAIQWYTNNSFIYRLINKALRTENIGCLCYFHFYISDLSKQLEKEFIKFKKQYCESTIKFYRSFKTTSEQIKNFQYNIGSLILTNEYLSTTRNREIVYDFIKQLNIQTNEEKVLCEYTIDLKLVKSIIFADISQYKQNSNDNEILFDIGVVFKINSCIYNEKDNLWIVNVSATDEGVDIASEYVEYQKAKMTDSNIMLMLGHLIIETGNYYKAEKYFDAILHSSIPNDEEISCIYYNMGRIYRLKGEYDRALEYLDQAYTTHSKARPARLISAAKAMNAMGIVYKEQNNITQAIESFGSALKTYGKTLQASHPDVAGTLINLGNIYCAQEEFTDALSCFNRAQRIYDRNLPPNHPNIAVLLNNIGNLYQQQSQLDLALNAYQSALSIYENILPPHHPDIVRNQHNISKIYIMLGDQKNPNFQLKQTAQCDLNIKSDSNMEIIEMFNF